MVRLLSKWRRAEQALIESQGRAPNFEEVAVELGLNDRQKRLVDKALIGLRPSGLGHEEREDQALLDARCPTPDARLLADDARTALRRRLARLSCRERRILRLQYGLGGKPPATLREIGRQLGLTENGVAQIAMDAMQKLGGGRAAESGMLDWGRTRPGRHALTGFRAPAAAASQGSQPPRDAFPPCRPHRAGRRALQTVIRQAGCRTRCL
jgi:DNA-directed RNA polymerase sigma subunit (sigma70/sigma32)